MSNLSKGLALFASASVPDTSAEDAIIDEMTINELLSNVIAEDKQMEEAFKMLDAVTLAADNFDDTFADISHLCGVLMTTGLTDAMALYIGDTVKETFALDLTDISDENREDLQNQLFEHLNEAGSNGVWDTLKKFFDTVMNAIKNFFKRLFSKAERYRQALVKYEKSSLKDLANMDADAYAAATVNGYDVKTWGDIIGNLGGLNKAIQTLDAGQIVKAAAPFGYKEVNEKLKQDQDGPETQKKTLKDLGFEMTKLPGQVAATVKALRGVDALKAAETKMEKFVKDAQRLCDDAKKEKDTEKFKDFKKRIDDAKNMASFVNSACGIYGKYTIAAAAQIVVACGKLKKKGGKKDKDEKDDK